MMLLWLLFISLFALLLLLIVPGEDASPAVVTVDYVNRYVRQKLISEEKETRLEILGRQAQDVVKSGLFIGAGLGLIGFLIMLGKIHWLAVPAGMALFFAGLMLVRFVSDNEFKKWQAKVFNDVPDLVSFLPAFLKTGAITLRGAMSMTLPFLTGPLQDEIWMALDKIKRTGNARAAFSDLSSRIGHPCMDSICLRLSTAWDASPSPEMFDDLSDQIRDIEEIAAARSTAGKAGMFALICVLGLLGAGMVFGYPAWIYMANKLTMAFGS